MSRIHSTTIQLLHPTIPQGPQRIAMGSSLLLIWVTSLFSGGGHGGGGLLLFFHLYHMVSNSLKTDIFSACSVILVFPSTTKLWHGLQIFMCMWALCMLVHKGDFGLYSLIRRTFVEWAQNLTGEIVGLAQCLACSGHPSMWWPGLIMLGLQDSNWWEFPLCPPAILTMPKYVLPFLHGGSTSCSKHNAK